MKENTNINIYFEKLFDTFVEKFEKDKGRRIVLYGIGAFSAAVIERLKDYNIVGLMDRDPANVGKILYGVPILSKEQAEEAADLVIINTEAAYWQTIYKRIYGIKIDVYYRNGERAFLEETPKCDKNLAYWSQNKKVFMGKVDEYPVISFDIFDTLITRKIYLPADVFQLVELRLKHDYGIDISFNELRTKALHTTGITEPNYDEIYRQFARLSGLDEETVRVVQELEFQVENSLMVPRRDVIEAMQYAKDKGKRVILVSDMYYSKARLEELLASAGVTGYDEIFVSCEYRKTKQSGELFDVVFEKYGAENVLHIGDHPFSDCEQPKQKGAEGFYIMSGRDLLANSSIKDIIPSICTLMDSLMMGTVVARLFNSPFALGKSKGTVVIENAEDMGYGLYAPLIFGFSHWLLQTAIADGIKKLLFFARDGWFLKDYFRQIYDYCRDNLNGPSIETEYFMISRRLAAVASIQSEEDFLEVAALPYKGIFAEYMEKRWNVLIDPEDERFHQPINTSVKFHELLEYMTPYKEQITKSIQADQRAYVEYCQGHTEGKPIGVVDTWYYGSCQWYLSKILQASINGYYFAVNLTENNRNVKVNTLRACYNDQRDPLCSNVACAKYSLHFESIFTAPHGMIRSYLGDGEFLFERKSKNQEEFWLREEVAQGVKAFIRDVLPLVGKKALAEARFNYDFCDKLYGIYWTGGGVSLIKEISGKMFNENFFQSSEEFLILE